MTKYDALNSLDNRAASKLSLAILEMEINNVPYFISQARRTLLEQCLYALQGRLGEIPQTDLEWACKKAGVRAPGNQKITWTLKSNHLDGLAVDIVPLKKVADPKDPNKFTMEPDWNNQDMRIVDAMKRAGFVWGGDWATPDRPHFELRLA
jgi:hypothetical protein